MNIKVKLYSAILKSGFYFFQDVTGMAVHAFHLTSDVSTSWNDRLSFARKLKNFVNMVKFSL